jgi:DnaJ homolog subfamily A member 2
MREIYDAEGMDGLSGPGSGRGRGPDPADIFAELFGGGFGGGFTFDMSGAGGPRRRKAQDSVIPYNVTLEDLYNGKTVKMNMEKEVECGVCSG